MERFIRQLLLKCLTGERAIVLTRTAPSADRLRREIDRVASLGLYLHVPFCEQICPYCPYNKELYRPGVAAAYARAVSSEIDHYAGIIGRKPITSFYIGGGTPTTMLGSGLAEMIEHAGRAFNLQCDIHMESHPNHLTPENLQAIKAIGVQHLSMGVEALSDEHLRTLCRPYTVKAVTGAVERAVAAGFTCVNVDVMFALPGQTRDDVENMGRRLVALGVDQVAAYPLFLFPYTAMGRSNKAGNHAILKIIERRSMLAILESIFYAAGYERTSAWAFTRRGVPRYCSVTVPVYIGLGASGGSYLPGSFHVNTFSAVEYATAWEDRRPAVALSLGLSERMQRAGWLYWRLYETRFRKADYRERFGEDIERRYGTFLRSLELLGFLKDDGERIVLSDKGSFWLHACEDLFSIDYISKLWGASSRNPWPGEVTL